MRDGVTEGNMSCYRFFFIGYLIYILFCVRLTCHVAMLAWRPISRAEQKHTLKAEEEVQDEDNVWQSSSSGMTSNRTSLISVFAPSSCLLFFHLYLLLLLPGLIQFISVFCGSVKRQLVKRSCENMRSSPLLSA